MWYKNGIDRSRNAWDMSAWKRITTFAPTQGLHISGYVPSRHRYCNSHISSYEWKIWIITTRQLRVYVTLLFPYFSHPYFIKAMEAHIGQHSSQATEMQTLCWSKTRTSFSGADNSYISWPINTIFAPRIGMYIRINIPKMDFIYLKIWCNSVIFCQRGLFFTHPVYIYIYHHHHHHHHHRYSRLFVTFLYPCILAQIFKKTWYTLALHVTLTANA